LDDHDFDPIWNVLLSYTDIIEVDIVECYEQVLIDNIDKYLCSNIKLITKKTAVCKNLKNIEIWDSTSFRDTFLLNQKL
jgi:hypothetical protein